MLSSDLSNQTCTTLDEYTNQRYLMGLAEGSQEIEFGKAFPLEHNLGENFELESHL